jgi:hypothetical protein
VKLGPNSKPHRGNAGYVCEMKCKLGGHIVIYDRESGFECDADSRWIVMHEPSSRHIEIKSLRDARLVMKGVAKAKTVSEARQHADILPTVEDNADHEEPVDKVRRGGFVVSDAERTAALDRFMADPENEPSPEGKAALAKAFDIRRKA